ncbi:MAG: 50S ribosomal protein L24 [Clostridia bacterium]|nr:50S ribosomal protein L24 [Clostridia bacterium]
MKLRKGDNVMVLSGNDKGKTGEILEIIPNTQKVVVKGVNIRKKHVKPRKAGEEGGIIASEYPIHSSKVNVVCPKCGKASKVGYVVEEGKKERICKKCGAKLK